MDRASEIIKLLEEKYILSSKNISDIREYINKKHPHSTPQKNTLVFANTINNIVEKHLSYFDAPYRPVLRKNILKKSLQKQSFSITANDVLLACIDTHCQNDNLIDEFETFTEKALGLKIPKDVLSRSFSLNSAGN